MQLVDIIHQISGQVKVYLDVYDTPTLTELVEGFEREDSDSAEALMDTVRAINILAEADETDSELLRTVYRHSYQIKDFYSLANEVAEEDFRSLTGLIEGFMAVEGLLPDLLAFLPSVGPATTVTDSLATILLAPRRQSVSCSSVVQ